jgi:predicted DCC family thiol-disulfide oxidoreductase YuxK
MTSVIVVFDAQCLLCSGWVQFLLKRDRKKIIKFASMQSAIGTALLNKAGLSTTNLETLLVIIGDRSHRNTAAILQILHAIGWPWRLAWIGWIIPAPLRDGLYRYVARNRYRLFGRRETCFISSSEYLERFF